MAERMIAAARLPCEPSGNGRRRELALLARHRGDGTSQEANIPTKWTGSENVAWKVSVPGTGHSSPAVWQDRVFLESCLEQDQAAPLSCFDGDPGGCCGRRRCSRRRWKAGTLNSFASSTPATDGHYVYASFLDVDKMLVAAYDFDGKQKWLVRPGGFSSKHGYCSSPILFEDKVIINGDHDGDAYLVALDRETGKTLWKVNRENKTRSYCTPIIRQIDGRPQMILSGSKSVASYDPARRFANLEYRWADRTVRGLDGGQWPAVFLTAGFPDHHIFVACGPTATAICRNAHIVWRTTENCSYVPSPIVVDDYFLVVADNGIASCYEADSGKRIRK